MLDCLIGKNIVRVLWDNEDGEYLIFVDDQGGEYAYTVDGDCCSSSYFHDFIGWDKLIGNGPVVSWRELPQFEKEDETYVECTIIYRYELVTVNEKFGEQTTVFSFRNESNGYYGGSMSQWNPLSVQRSVMVPLEGDKV